MAEAAPQKARFDIALFTAQPLLLDDKKAAGEVDVDGFKTHFKETLFKIGKKVSCVHKFATTTNLTKVGIEGTRIVHLVLHGSKKPNFLTIENTARVGFASNYSPEKLEPILDPLLKQVKNGSSPTRLFFVYSKHADITCDLLSKLGVEYVVGFRYLYGGEDPAGRDFQDKFYDLLLNGESIGNAFKQAQTSTLMKYKSDEGLRDRIIIRVSAGGSADVPLFKLDKGNPDWNNSPSPHFFPAPDSETPVVGFNEVISKALDSIQNGTSVTWITGMKGSGKTTLGLQVCKYLAERDYVDDKPLPIIYVPLKMYEKIRSDDRNIQRETDFQDHFINPVQGPGLSYEVGKIMQHLGAPQKKFCHELTRCTFMIKQKKIEIEQQEGRIQRLERKGGSTTDAYHVLQALRDKLEDWKRKINGPGGLREVSKEIDFALSPFAGIRGTQLYKSLGKKYKAPWLLVIDGLDDTRFNGGSASKTVETFLRGLIKNNEHLRLMICSNYDGKLNLPYVSQTSFSIPKFPLTTKINLFLNHRPEKMTRMEFGEISREQLIGYLKESAIVQKLLPQIEVAQGIIDLSAELKDTMLSCVSRVVMSSLVLIRGRYDKLKATGSLPNLIYIDDYQRSLVSSKWTVWASPSGQPASIPKIGLNTAKKRFEPVFIGKLQHYDFADNGKPGKIGEFDLEDKFDEDIVSIVLDGILDYKELSIRSPFGVTYYIEQMPNYSNGPVTLKVTDIDTPDENVLYKENNEFGLYWQANILPTLPPDLQQEALEFRAKTGDGLDGDEEAEGTLKMAPCLSWSAAEVADFVRNIAPLAEYQTYAVTFEENGVTGSILEDLDDTTLMELGVSKRLHRTLILNKTRALLDS